MKIFWAVGALSCLCACAGPRPARSIDADVSAAMRTVAEAKGVYKIAPGDLLSVSVYQDKDMSARAQVDDAGALSMPVLGQVNVAGATIAEAQKRIEGRLARYLVNPQVSVTIEAYGNKQLFVLGEVQRPGPYPIPTGTRVTVLQAITAAGGFTRTASPRRTHVLRYAGGKSQDYKVDLKAVIGGGDRGNDLVLEPNDVIYVPQTLF